MSAEFNALETKLDFDTPIITYCMDGGKCIYKCNGDCARVKCDKPLPNSGFDDEWNPI